VHSKELDAKLKTALDESRLLILGAQVLLGFAFQAAFQDLFSEIEPLGRFFHILALCLLCLSVAFLVVPSFYHQIACNGCSLHRALHVATSFANWSLLPLMLGLGASGYVIIARLAGPEAGLAFGGALTATALCLLYGLGFALRKSPKPLPPEGNTALNTKIEQMLTEARVIIPGGQALLGFQFVATLTKSFDALPLGIKCLHVSSLAAVSLSVLLLMTPAALHRLAFHGEDDPQFFIIGSRLVIAAALPLALGISGDISVVVFKITESGSVSAAVGIAAAAAFLSAWYLYPSLVVLRK
jgi:hypothetical protein